MALGRCVKIPVSEDSEPYVDTSRSSSAIAGFTFETVPRMEVSWIGKVLLAVDCGGGMVFTDEGTASLANGVVDCLGFSCSTI